MSALDALLTESNRLLAQVRDERDAARNAIKGLRAFLKMVDDFGNMGTGQFVREYPDCGPYEGYGYVQRKAKVIGAAIAKARGQ